MKVPVLALYGGILIAGIVAPLLFPNYTFQIAVLWMMILFALTWDIAGGQMGYNSLGNIIFFGAGMYISAIVQISMVYDVGEYTAAFGAIKIEFIDAQYFTGLFLGIIAAPIGAVVCALVLGMAVFGLRGPYFAIGTLGLALAVAELVAGWNYVGGGGGISGNKWAFSTTTTDADPGSGIFRLDVNANISDIYILVNSSQLASGDGKKQYCQNREKEFCI